VKTAIYGVLQDDTGAIQINLEFFELKEILEGGGRRGQVPE